MCFTKNISRGKHTDRERQRNAHTGNHGKGSSFVLSFLFLRFSFLSSTFSATTDTPRLDYFSPHQSGHRPAVGPVYSLAAKSMIYRPQASQPHGPVKGAFRTAAKRPADYGAKRTRMIPPPPHPQLTTAGRFCLIVNTRTLETPLGGGHGVVGPLAPAQDLSVLPL